MADPKTYFLELPSNSRPPIFSAPEKIYSDIHWYNSNRASNRRYHAVNGIEGVVIHATAGGSTAGALSWWKGTPPNGAKASAHWIVPDEDEAAHGSYALAVVYESLAAWHMRKSATHSLLGNKDKINHWSLGIEIVNRQNNSDTFSDWQYEITALLVRYCWAKYPNMKYIFSHALVDPKNRSDPGDEFDWEKLKSLILSSANDPNTDHGIEELVLAAAHADIPSSYTEDDSCCM